MPQAHLARELLAALGADAPAAVAVDADALAVVIDELLQRARAEEPTIELGDAEFVRYVGQRCHGVEDLLGHLRSLRAGDLWLACACAAANRRALQRFGTRFGADIDAAIARSANAAVGADDFRQHLMSKLFTADGDGQPRIAEYSGRGALRGWLRITIVRQVIDFVRRAQRRELGHQVDEVELLGLRAATADPELAYARNTYELELREALRDGFAALSPRERNLLRHFIVHDLGIDDVARIYGVHRATAHRWRLKAQDTLFKATRAALRSRLGTDTLGLKNALAAMESQLHITVRRYLSREPEPEPEG